MAIDLLNLQPTTISRDLKGKYILLYGQPKVGKTTFASQFPNNLLLAFEHGYNAIAGIKAVDITKWSDFKLVLRQLEQPAVRAMYDTITIDTVQIAWNLCESYICAQASVQTIGDIPWGKGYDARDLEFENCLRKITMLGYGLVLLTHVDIRKEKIKGENDEEYVLEYYSPALNKRCYPICNRIVDIIGYIGTEWDDKGNSSRWLYTRETPRVKAGTRYKYLAPKIPFGYTELVNAISEAIEKDAQLDGAVVVDKSQNIFTEDTLDFATLRAEAQELWTKLVGTGEDANEEMAKRILKRVEMIFGRPMKLSEITEDQVDLMQLVVVDMRDLAQSK